MAPKVWLITGACSGFGRLMTELVLENGDICVATSIDPPALSDLFPKYGKERLRSIHVDVTHPDDVSLAFTIAEQTYGHVDVVFNNAGIATAAEVEGTPNDRARAMFEVNFWGVSNVTREAIHFFREVNGPERGGKLLQMASIAGVDGYAALGYYSASKHAVEGLTKALAKELKPEWNIQVMLIEPGFFRTPMLKIAPEMRVETHPAYVGGPGEQTRLTMTHAKGGVADPQKGMELVHKVAQMDKLPLHLPLAPSAIYGTRVMAAELLKAADDWESSQEGLVLPE